MPIKSFKRNGLADKVGSEDIKRCKRMGENVEVGWSQSRVGEEEKSVEIIPRQSLDSGQIWILGMTQTHSLKKPSLLFSKNG